MEALDRPWLLRTAVLGLALVAGVVAWLSVERGDEPAPASAPAAQIVEAAEVANLPALYGHPVYWAGPMTDRVIEVAENPQGGVSVRYLEDDSELGDEAGRAPAVVSYPLADPAGALRAFASEPGSIVRRSAAGRRVVTSAEQPTSAYFASPDNSVQVEVYDPSPRRALELALSERVRPAG